MILCFSGGIDSTTLLYYALKSGLKVKCLSINYGQRHTKELSYAQLITNSLPRVKHKIIDLSVIKTLLSSSVLTGNGDIPEGHYMKENMKATIVPNRNMILLSLAAAWAIDIKDQSIGYASHAGDHTIYPDCRLEFVGRMKMLLHEVSWEPLKLFTPFLYLNKSDIIRIGEQLNVPYHQTWSCYKGEELHCGKCGTCIERKEAFKLAEVDDPTVYKED